MKNGVENNLGTYPVQETLEKPFESVDARVDAVPVQVLFQFGQKFVHDFIMMFLVTQQLGEARYEESWMRAFREKAG